MPPRIFGNSYNITNKYKTSLLNEFSIDQQKQNINSGRLSPSRFRLFLCATAAISACKNGCPAPFSRHQQLHRSLSVVSRDLQATARAGPVTPTARRTKPPRPAHLSPRRADPSAPETPQGERGEQEAGRRRTACSRPRTWSRRRAVTVAFSPVAREIDRQLTDVTERAGRRAESMGRRGNRSATPGAPLMRGDAPPAAKSRADPVNLPPNAASRHAVSCKSYQRVNRTVKFDSAVDRRSQVTRIRTYRPNQLFRR